MLRFRQKKIIAVFVLLSLSLNSFADTGLKEKNSTNLVELFKVKAHATEHIKGIEAKLLATNDADQEELLVELAQSLLYYQDKHNKESDTKGATSKSVRLLSANGTSGKVSKVARSRGPYSPNIIYYKALNAYKKASKLSLNKNRIKYTRELSELTVKLQKKNELVQIFDELLQHGEDEKGIYLAHIDYADGLAKFKDNTAEIQYLSAIDMRTTVNGVEANFRYAKYLLEVGKLNESLSIINKFTFEDRKMYVHIALLRHKMMHLLKMGTREVDDEINQLRTTLSSSPFISYLPKVTGLVKNKFTNILGLPKAYAFAFVHNNEGDDSRGESKNIWVSTPPVGKIGLSSYLVNLAEVIYNEVRGEGQKTRYAVAWAIRNRATINMNGCDYYPGAEGHPNVNECRGAAPIYRDSDYSHLYSMYSCVIHGGTTDVGAAHSQMNDAHIEIENLISSGIIWEILYVIRGLVPDPTGPKLFLTGVYPDTNFFTGNPRGAQEWRRQNYCAEKHECKARLGNVGGNFLDIGNICPKDDGHSTDIFFWGRNPVPLTLNLE